MSVFARASSSYNNRGWVHECTMSNRAYLAYCQTDVCPISDVAESCVSCSVVAIQCCFASSWHALSHPGTLSLSVTSCYVPLGAFGGCWYRRFRYVGGMTCRQHLRDYLTKSKQSVLWKFQRSIGALRNSLMIVFLWTVLKTCRYIGCI